MIEGSVTKTVRLMHGEEMPIGETGKVTTVSGDVQLSKHVLCHLGG